MMRIAVPPPRALSTLQLPPRACARSCMPRRPNAGPRHGADPAAVVADRKRKPWSAVGVACDFAQLDGHMPSLRMPNDVGQAFLNAAVNREVDRVAIAAHEVVRANREFDLRMLP